MYYILYEGLKIESNEPVYCTVYSVKCKVYSVHLHYNTEYLLSASNCYTWLHTI